MSDLCSFYKRMVSNRDEWIRIFDIPDTSKHKNGFTIYKVVSMLYPESCPDAVTKVTVWKRFNDFKKLHREIKVLHKKLGLQGNLPSIPNNTLFKRFDEETIKQRKLGNLQFLEFIAKHSQLFTSNVFVKFLEVSHTPVKHLNSNINLIRADLNLPEDPEVSTVLNTSTSDDERTISDTDSISTIGSLTAQSHDMFTDPTQKITRNLKRLPSTYSIDSQSSRASETYSIATSIDTMLLLDSNQVYPTPPMTPSSSSLVGDNVQYLIDASIHVNFALELENDRKYEQAFTAYKTAIDILIKYGKDDANYDRRQMVRYKTEKYLIRAEKIYNMYLAPEIRDLQFSTPLETTQPTLLGDLYKFKVMRIIASGMLVLHLDLQQIFYIKVVHKTMEFLNERLILPENVPYMVKLHNHYNREDALFLLLEYRSGTRLTDYIKNQTTEELTFTKDQQILKQIEEYSDNESELSYSELINDYSSNRATNKENVYSETKDESSEDDSFEKVDMSDVLLYSGKNKSMIPVKNVMDEPLKKGVVKTPITPINSDNITSTDNNVASMFIKSNQTSKALSTKNENLNSRCLSGTRTRTDLDTDKPHLHTEIHTEKPRLQPETDTEESRLQTEKDSSRIARLRAASRRKSSEMSSFSCDDLEFDRSLLVPEETVVEWAAQLLLALEKLHALGVICRDLQTKNLLIDEKNDLVLTYMCNIKDLCDLYSNGVNINLAPEVYSYNSVTEAVDWWSYGAILYEMLVGMPLSDIHSNGITSYTHIKIPRYISPEARSLLRQLLTYNPQERLGSGSHGTENIKSHPFFSSISWDALTSKYKK